MREGKIGPKTNPCRTPCKSTDQELNDLLILIFCSANQWTNFYMIETSAIKESMVSQTLDNSINTVPV